MSDFVVIIDSDIAMSDETRKALDGQLKKYHNKILAAAITNVLEEHGFKNYTIMDSIDFILDDKEQFVYNLRGGDTYYDNLIRQEYFRLYDLYWPTWSKHWEQDFTI